jgi:predicted Zn-dependent protease
MSVGRRERLEEMLREAPDDPELRYMLAMEDAAAGDDAAAVRAFEELLARCPDYPPGYHMLARTLQRLGRDTEAVAVLQRGIPVAAKRGDLHAAGEMQQLLDMMD